MADRIVTDLTAGVYRRQYSGFIRGKRINSISLSAEAWFWRFHAAADDFGNAPADRELAFAETVGRRKGITPEQVQAWLKECADVGLVRTYDVDDERFYHVTGWELKQPAGKNGKRVRHYPASPWDAKVNGLDDSGLIPVNPDSTSASDSHSDSHSDSPQAPRPKRGDVRGRNGSRGRRSGRMSEIDDACKAELAKRGVA